MHCAPLLLLFGFAGDCSCQLCCHTSFRDSSGACVDILQGCLQCCAVNGSTQLHSQLPTLKWATAVKFTMRLSTRNFTPLLLLLLVKLLAKHWATSRQHSSMHWYCSTPIC
jgi:hypothetical protein